MKSLIIAILAFLSLNAFASKTCRLLTTVDPNRKLMIFRFTTETSSDLVTFMSLNKSCLTVLTAIMSDFPRNQQFAGETLATVFVFKYDSEDPINTSFHLTVFQQNFEVIELKDKTGIQVVPMEYADRLRQPHSPESSDEDKCRAAISLDLNAKTVNVRLTKETSSDLLDLWPLEKNCTMALVDLMEGHPASVMFDDVEYANVYIYKHDPHDPLRSYVSLTAFQNGYEMIPMLDKSGIKFVEKSFKDRVKP